MDKLQTGTIKSFQGIRFLAFMGIFLGHVDVSLGKLAGTCVTIFFVLSGYVMYSKYRNMDLDTGFVSLINFGWKRIRSLYPLHILTMLSLIPLCIGRVIILGGVTYLQVLIRTLLNIVLLQAWVPIYSWAMSINGVTWYLSVALFLYTIFPIILKYLKNKNVNTMIIIVIIAIGCQYLWRILVIELTKDSSIGTLTYSLNYCFPIYRIPDFLVGCCLSAISNLRGTKMSYLQASIGEIIIVALTITYGYMMFSGKILISANCNNTYALIIVAMTIYIMGFEMGIVSKLLSCNIMVCLGDLSKYTYLIHFVVVEWIGAFEIVGIFKLNIPIKIILNVVFTYTLTFAYVKLRKKFAI